MKDARSGRHLVPLSTRGVKESHRDWKENQSAIRCCSNATLEKQARYPICKLRCLDLQLQSQFAYFYLERPKILFIGDGRSWPIVKFMY